MTDLVQPTFTPQDFDELQRLRALTSAFQRVIANLDATEQNNSHNEQFNKIRAETKAIFSRYGLKVSAPKAVTSAVIAQRGQQISTRLSGVVIFGVLLALVGLGINSIILEDVIINSLGCLISSGGMLLVIGAFAVWALTSVRRTLTNLGDLYLRTELLLQQLDEILRAARAGYASPVPVETPKIPSAIALAVDSLEKQAADWQQKLANLNQQRRLLGVNSPVELTTTINYVQRELDRIEYELVNLRERVDLPLSPEPEPVSPPAPRPAPEVVRAAQAFTQEMPVQKAAEPESTEAIEAEETLAEPAAPVVEPEEELDTRPPQ